MVARFRGPILKVVLHGAKGAYSLFNGAIQAPNEMGATMSDKSPHKGLTKKSGKSLKEKRADKKAKAAGSEPTEIVNVKKR